MVVVVRFERELMLEAVRKGDVEAVQRMLQAGADVDGADDCLNTPLHVATAKNNAEVRGQGAADHLHSHRQRICVACDSGGHPIYAGFHFMRISRVGSEEAVTRATSLS